MVPKTATKWTCRACCFFSTSLQDTGGGDGGAGLVLNLAVITTGSLKSSNNVHGPVVSDLAEDDVAAVQPGGDDGGDEELRAVAVFLCS